MRIGVIGCGFVGLSNAALLAFKEKVYLWDTDYDRLRMIGEYKVPFNDSGIEEVFLQRKVIFNICNSLDEIIAASELVILALPTDYDVKKNMLNTEGLELTIAQILAKNSTMQIIIKSTIPVGFVDRIRRQYNAENIFFIPEFLREGVAYRDVLYPDRVIIGGEADGAEIVSEIYRSAIEMAGGKMPDPVYVSAAEAEAIKLFSNTYLAMRIAFFNELDIFAEKHGLNTANIIEGICGDPRIGNYYNNPSFGYAGYCLPKDTKQTAELMGDDGVLIGTIEISNTSRKKYILRQIEKSGEPIGIYLLSDKSGQDRTRNSVMIELIEKLTESGHEVYLYDPYNDADVTNNRIKTVESLHELDQACSVILANRLTEELRPYVSKVYSRDAFRETKGSGQE